MAAASRPVLALVPARAGSKGIARKNLVKLAGRPLLAYTVEAALQASSVDETWVSSDDSEMLALAEHMGASALRRPPQLASDDASAIGVVQHFLHSLHHTLLARNPFVVYLQPTSPLRVARHIDEAMRLVHEHNADSLVSVVGCEKSPFKSFGLDESGRLKSLFDERLSNARRQDLPVSYFPNGAIYVFTAHAFEERGGFPSNGSIPYVMPPEVSVDIDSLHDIQRAETLLGAQHA